MSRFGAAYHGLKQTQPWYSTEQFERTLFGIHEDFLHGAKFRQKLTVKLGADSDRI